MPTSIEVSEKAGVRYLHFSAEWIQGAMRIQKPNALELAYTREMMAGLLLREPPWPREALLIGLGAGMSSGLFGIGLGALTMIIGLWMLLRRRWAAVDSVLDSEQ